MTMRRIQVPPVPVYLLPVFSGLFSIPGIGGLQQFRRLPVADFMVTASKRFAIVIRNTTYDVLS
jgi:hypothetical protein